MFGVRAMSHTHPQSNKEGGMWIAAFAGPLFRPKSF
jgi:hypothetical protein